MKLKFKNLVALLLVCALLGGFGAVEAEAAGQQNTAAAARHILTRQTYTLYLKSLDNTLDAPVPLYFADGQMDIPYVELSDWVKLITELNKKLAKDSGYKLTVRKNGDHVTLQRENKSTMDLDFGNNVMYFDDYDALIQHSQSETLIDLLTNHSVNEEGEALLIERVEEGSFFRYGKPITVSLYEYEIEMFAQDGKFYMPLQTMSDVLISPLGVCLVFNGQTSGGGSCVIQPYSTAYGSLIQLSGPMRLSFMKNGSFYDIDQGVDPDCYLAKPSSFYLRRNLVKYLNSLM